MPDPIEDLLESAPDIVSRGIDQYCLRISRAFGQFMANMPRLGCDGSLFSQHGTICREVPTIMLDEDFERTFNQSNMEVEFCEPCFRKFRAGTL